MESNQGDYKQLCGRHYHSHVDNAPWRVFRSEASAEGRLTEHFLVDLIKVDGNLTNVNFHLYIEG